MRTALGGVIDGVVEVMVAAVGVSRRLSVEEEKDDWTRLWCAQGSLKVSYECVFMPPKSKIESHVFAFGERSRFRSATETISERCAATQVSKLA